MDTETFQDLDFKQYDVKDEGDTVEPEVQHLVLFGGRVNILGFNCLRFLKDEFMYSHKML